MTAPTPFRSSALTDSTLNLPKTETLGLHSAGTRTVKQGKSAFQKPIPRRSGHDEPTPIPDEQQAGDPALPAASDGSGLLASAQNVSTPGLTPAGSSTTSVASREAAAPVSKPTIAQQMQQPLSEHTSWSVASWFGAAPTGAILSGSLLSVAAVQSMTNKPSNPLPATDTQAPLLLSAEISHNSGTQLLLKYSETLNAVLPAANAFVVMADGARVGVSSVARGSDPTSVLLTLSTPISSLQQVLVSLSDGSQIRDLVGNTASTFRDQAVTVSDKIAPTLLKSTAISNTSNSLIVLQFSEALNDDISLDPQSFQISVDGTPQTILSQTVSGDSIRLTLANKITSANPIINLSYTPPLDASKAVQDLTGNLASVIGPLGGVSVSHTADNTAPTLNSDALAVVGTERQVRVIRLNFNEALDASALPPVSSFLVSEASGGQIRGVTVSSLKLQGSTLDLILASTVTDPLSGLRVSYTPAISGPALQDWAGNPVAMFERSVATVDAAPPNLLSTRFTTDRTLELTFDETLASQGPGPERWSLRANEGMALNPLTSTVAGRTLTLTFAAPVQIGQNTSLAYSAPPPDASPLNLALQDSLGNDSGSFSRTLDSTAPVLSSAVTSTNGLQVLLNYSEALLAPNTASTPVIPAVSANAFLVRKTNGGESITVSAVNIVGSQVQLTLASAIKPGDNVSVIYTPPASSIGVNNAALQDSSGNDAAALGSGVTGLTVTNNTVLAAISTKLDSQNAALDQVVIQFNEHLSTTLPASNAFAVRSGGVEQSLTQIALDPSDHSKLVLTLNQPLDDPGALLVSYTRPSSNPLQGVSGKTWANVSDQNFGHLITSTSGNDTLNGAANRADYFLGSAGNDTISGLGGNDQYVWPDFGDNGPNGFTQTLQDFGFKNGVGLLQGNSEADTLDLSQLLNGYTQANSAAFLRAIKTADNKLLLQVDHDGGSVFQPTANFLFNNVSVNANDQLRVNDQFISHSLQGVTSNLTLATLVEHLRIEGQLAVL